MTDKKPTATRYDREIRRAVFKHHDNYSNVKLGDLRQIVAAAEGMGDDAAVTVVGTSRHWQRADEWNVKGIWIMEEIPMPVAQEGWKS